MDLSYRHLFLLTSGLLLASGACGASAPPPICQPAAAYNTGRNQALGGQAINYQVGGMCQGNSHAEFQKQLYAGYGEGLRQYCVPAMVSEHGRADGRQGGAARFDARRYSVCTQQQGFAEAYQAGHQAGVSEFCVPTAAAQAGYNAGLQGQNVQFDSRPYGVCVGPALQTMAAEFTNAHARGVGEYCGKAVSQVRAQAVAQGRSGQSTRPQSYPLCPQPQILAAHNEGTRAGLQEFCRPDNAAAAGLQRGQQGAASDYNSRSYGACSRQQERTIARAYSQSYNQGISGYCQQIVQTSLTRNRELGAAGQPFQSNAQFGNCPTSTVSRARTASRQAYAQGLAQYCAAPEIESIGQRDGQEGRLGTDALRPYQACTPRLLAGIQARYQRGADAGLAVFCGDEQLRRSARQFAKTTNRAGLPQVFGVCQRRYPDTARAFQAILLQERERIISTQCTYQRGQSQGRKDARASNRKRTNQPNFCDRTAFNVYLTGYLEGWNNKKGNLCSATDAYERGRQDANAGRASSYRPQELCRSQTRQLSDKYLEGYRDATRILQDGKRRDQWEREQQANGNGNGNPDQWNGGNRNTPEWRERERLRRIAKRHADAKRAAYTICLRKGYSPSSCNQVTNRVCLEKGYGPSSCNLPTLHLKAVNTCLKKGYGPSSCTKVTSVRCLEKGYGPSSCALSSPVHKAVDLCLDKGYSPSSCNGITNWECINQGHSPSSCR